MSNSTLTLTISLTSRPGATLAGAPTDHTAAIAEKAREYRDIVGRLADDASPAAYDAADDAQDHLFAAVDAERAEREADRG